MSSYQAHPLAAIVAFLLHLLGTGTVAQESEEFDAEA